jgi:HEAT repeat protein
MNHQMTPTEQDAFEFHLASCKSCQQEFETSKHIFDLLDRVPLPEPSSDMQVRFQGMLDAYKHSLDEKNRFWKNLLFSLQQLWSLQPGLQLAYSIILVMTGLAAGYTINQQDTGNGKKHQIQELSLQVEEMQQLMMLTLVENPSASKRLQAVSYTDEISSVKIEVIDALLTTLNEDPNVNVRLATLEALVKFSEVPRVREGLVQSITQQESPLVQSAMVDVMLKLQEKRSVVPLQQLLNKKDLNQTVKIKIENSIHQLI